MNKNSKQDNEITFDDFDYKKNEILNQIDFLGENCDGVVAIGDKDFPSENRERCERK